MLHLSHIPIWLNASRLRFLRSFRRDLEAYFGLVSYEAFPFRVVETDEARALRDGLEPRLRKCRRVVGATGQVSLLRLAPGEHAGDVDKVNLISEVFHLDRFNLERDDVFQALAKAEKAYEDNRMAAWLRTVNPLFWLDLFLNYVEHIPFLPLRLFGVRSAKAAATPLGRAVRHGSRLVALTAVLWVVLVVAGLDDPAVQWVQALWLKLPLWG